MTLFEFALKRTNPIHFYTDSNVIETWSAHEVLAKACAISTQMHNCGIQKGDCVALMLPTSIDLITYLLAAWGCAATVCIVPHTLGERAGQLDAIRLTHILELLKPKIIIHHHSETIPFPQSKVQQINFQHWQNAPQSSTFPNQPTPNDQALIQLTSGSTAYPKGVILHHNQMSANMRAVNKRTGATVNDHIISWLPLYHDMGLAALLLALCDDIALTLIPTNQFMRNPYIWTEAISNQRGTISMCPTFAYALLARQKRVLDKKPIDLSSWRYAFVGAEPVYQKYLLAFEEVMRSFGLQENVLQPSYGLAEAVVAVAHNPAGTRYRFLSIGSEELHRQGLIRIVDPQQTGSLTLVSNGMPIEGISLSIRRPNGDLVADNEQGNVWISGDCITKGYINDADSDRFKDGWFDTGDLGFIHEQELYISGRAKDLIIRGGANFSPAYVELVVESCLNLRSGKVIAFSCQNSQHDKEEVIVVVGMQPSNEQRSVLIREVTKAVASELGLQIDQVLFTPANNIPKTTSGKVQRAAIKQSFLNNTLVLA